MSACGVVEVVVMANEHLVKGVAHVELHHHLVRPSAWRMPRICTDSGLRSGAGAADPPRCLERASVRIPM